MDPGHRSIFQQCAKDLDLVIDMRKMTNKKGPSSSSTTIMSSMVHPDSPWSKGHMLHAFFEKKCVLSLVVSISDVQSAGDGGAFKRALEAVQMVKCMDVEYDEPSSPAPATVGGGGGSTSNKPVKVKKIKLSQEPQQPPL